MIYIKYTDKSDPYIWFIFAHVKGSKIETYILNFNGDTTPYKEELNLKKLRRFYITHYLTEEEVDLIKLEYL